MRNKLNLTNFCSLACASARDAFTKRLPMLAAVATLLMVCAVQGWGQTTGDYRSRQSGDWNDGCTWERYNGTNWVVQCPFPEVAGTASSSKNITTGTTHAVSLPAGIASGDLLLIFWADANDVNTAPTTPSGWTQLYTNNAGSRYRVAWYKVADGTESTTINITAGAERSAHNSYRIAAGTYQGVPVAASPATGNSNSANPPNLTSGFGNVNTLWIAAAHSVGDENAVGAPTDFGNQVSGYTGNTGNAHARMVTARREFQATSQDPGAFGNYSANREWAANTIAIQSVTTIGTPTSTSGAITIRSPHTVTFNAAITVDQVVIESGATVTQTANMTIANGLGDDLVVDGTLNRTGGDLTIQSGANMVVNGTYSRNGGNVTTTGTLAFNNGGIYIHNINGGTVPTATWNANSNCNITGMAGTYPGGMGQTFGNVAFVRSSANNVTMGSNLTCLGNLTHSNSNTGVLSMTTSGTNRTIDVGGSFSMTSGNFTMVGNNGTATINTTGDFSISGGTLNMKTGNGAAALNVTGNFTKTGGTFNQRANATSTSIITVGGNFSHSSGTYDMSGANAIGVLNVAGNFSITGGTITESSTGSGSINFNGSGNQTYTSGGTVSNIINFTVNSGAFLQMAAAGTTVTGGGSFTLSNGATLGIRSTAGITSSGATGNVQVTGTRTFNTGANYVYNGTAAQNTGNGLPATVNNLTFDNTGGAVTLNSARNITNDFSITTGSIANLGAALTHTANTLTLGGAGTVNGSWGHPSSPATNTNNVFFANATGIVNVATNSSPCVSLTTTAGSNSPVCEGEDLLLTASDATGGTPPYEYNWEGPGGYTSDEQNPTRANATPAMGGTYTVTVTDADGCTGTSSMSVTVNAAPACSITGFDLICAFDEGYVYTAPLSSNYEWSVTGGTIIGSNTNQSVVVDAGNVGTMTVFLTVTDANGCTSTCEESFTVNPHPDITLTDSDLEVCAGDTDAELPYSGTSESPNQYSLNFDAAAEAEGFVDVTNATLPASPISVVVPGGAAPGTYNAILTVRNSTTVCVSPEYPITITIHPLPEATCPDDFEVCINAGSQTLTATPAGGVYSGAGTSGNQFSPSTAGVGTHTITYTYTDGNGCVDVCEFDITVNPQPAVTCPADLTVCINGTPIDLTALAGVSPAGGTFSGAGVTANTFNPAAAGGVGNKIITYVVTDGNGCTNACTFTITVAALPTVTCPANQSVCVDELPLDLTTLGALPAGGTFSGTGVTGDEYSAGAGTTNTVTYTFTDGNGCTNSCNFNITVNALPVMDCPDAQEVCVDELPLDLTTLGALPAGGTFSGTGVTGNSYSAGAGTTNTVTYTFTDGNGCTNSCDFDITVNALPVVTCPDDVTVCLNASPLNLTGGTPGGGVFTGTGVTGNQFDPSVGVGDYTITYTASDANGCSNTCTFVITVVAPIPPTCPDDEEVCENDDPFTLTDGTPGGGSFSGPGVTGNTFNPAAASLGANVITYTATDANGCSASCTFTITVNAAPEPTCPEPITVCVDGDPVDLEEGDPTGGTFSGDGVTGNQFNPGAVGGAGSYTVTYTVTDANGCTGTCEFTVTVVDGPVIDECPEDVTICFDELPYTLSGGDPSGGTFSGDHVDNGSFDPPGPGTYEVTYTISDDNDCETSCTFEIEVLPLPAIDVCPADVTVCIDELPLTLTQGEPEGTFSGDGVDSDAGTFDATEGGEYTITYTVEDANGCTNTCEFTVTVNELPELDCPVEPITVCVDEEPFELTYVTPAGGDYSGDGVDNNTFDPAEAGVGDHDITYTYTDPVTECTNTCTFVITVVGLPVVDCPEDITVCIDDEPFALDAGGEHTGDGVDNNTFDPAAANLGENIITFTVTGSFGCTATCTYTITVKELPVVECPESFSVCINASPFALAGGTPAGGTYSGTGVSGGNFNPALAGVGSHLITYTYADEDGCESSCTFFITVNPLPVVECPAGFEVCIDEPTFPLTGATPDGGTYSGDGVVAGNFNAALAGAGAKTITYTYTDGNGCTNFCDFTITVKPLPVVTCPNEAIDVCVDDEAIGLTSLVSPAGGTFEGPGVTGTNFNPADAGVGSHTITYTYTDDDTDCTNSCSFTIDVNALPLVTCPAAQDVCIDVPAFLLTGGTPAGGTYSGDGVDSDTGEFDPEEAGLGTHTLTYTYQDDNGCENSCTFDITVIEAPVATCPTVDAVCLNEAPFLLAGGLPTGGTYSGPGVSGGIFTASTAGVGLHTITYTVTVAGCTDDCTFDIQVNGIPAVTFTGPGTCLSLDGASVDLTALASPAGGTFSGPGVVGNEFVPSEAGVGIHVVTYTVTDGTCSNTATAAFEVVDQQPLVLAIEAPATAQCNETVTVSVVAQSGFDAITGISYTLSWNPDELEYVSSAGDDFDGFLFIDDLNAANGQLGYFFFSLFDGITIPTPPDVELLSIEFIAKACNGAASIVFSEEIYPIEATNENASLCLPLEVDAAGAEIDIQDDIEPEVTCPTPDAFPAVNCEALVTFDPAVATDNCDTDVEVTYVDEDNNPVDPAGTTFPVGQHVVTVTATDDCGNTATCEILIKVVDEDAPVIDCDLILDLEFVAGPDCTSDENVAVPVAEDDCDGEITATGVRSDGEPLDAPWPLGATTITWTFEDQFGNATICEQVVTVVDETAPEITCPDPATITVSNDPGECSAVVNFAATAIDNCDEAVTIVYQDENEDPVTPGTTVFPVGTTIVTAIASDISGNSAECTITIVVNDDEDPALDCPLDPIEVSTDPGICTASTAAIGASATDNCDDDVQLTFSPAAPYPLGETIVTVTATDEAGNTAECTVTVTVIDDELPTIECPDPVEVLADAGACVATGVLLGEPTASDNCGVDEVTNDAPTEFPVGETTVTYTVTDVNGNTATCTQVVTVIDDEDPELICPSAPLVFDNDPGECSAIVEFADDAVTAFDNCGTPTITYAPPSGSEFPVGTTQVTVTATDASGNTATCILEVTVEDNEEPTLTCPGNITKTADAGECSTRVNFAATATDNCGDEDPSIVYTNQDNVEVFPGLVDGTQFPVGTTIVTATATDENGGTSTCTFAVTITDDEKPTIDCPANVGPIVPVDPVNCVFKVDNDDYNPAVGDNCGVETLEFTADNGADPASGSTLNGSIFLPGVTTVVWTVTDVNGLTNTCAFTITVEPCREISGKLIWKGDAIKGVGQGTVFLTGDQNATFGPTAADGLYSFSIGSGSNFVIKPEKKINPLNGVTAADVTAILQHIVGSNVILDQYRRVAADINKDLLISVVDANFVNQALRGNETALDTLTKNSWTFIPEDFVFPAPALPPLHNAIPAYPQTIVLTGLLGDAIDQDFFGVKMADVNEQGFPGPGPGIADPANKPSEGVEPVLWTVQDRVLQAGEEVVAEFAVSNFNDIAAYQFALNFDPSRLKFERIETTGNLPLSMNANFGLFKVEEGEIRALYAVVQGKDLSNGTAVFRVHFTALESGQKLSDLLGLAPKVLPEVAYNTALQMREVNLVFTESETTNTNNPLQAQMQLLQNQPNPFTDRTNIIFVLPEACEAELRVLDVTGRLLRAYNAYYSAGTHQVTFELNDASATGLLYYELITPYGKLSRKMVASGN
ncbi:MAG: HYR domain-containing protein [Saprospiraceae bacterium]|nr:HYR domain-containing protein [Saprospiraceae bacterium]